MRYIHNHLCLCLQKSFKLHRQPAQCCICSIASDLSLSITPWFFFSLCFILVIFYIIIDFRQKLETSSDVSICPAVKTWNQVPTGCWRNKVWNQTAGWRLHASPQKHGAVQLFIRTCAHTWTGQTQSKPEVNFFRHYSTQNEMKQMSIWPASQNWWLFTSSKQQRSLAHHLLPNTCLSLLVMFCLM